MYKGQEGARTDFPLAFAILWLGCTAQYYDSCVEMSRDDVTYFGYQGSRPEVQVFSAACADGTGPACYALAQYYMNYQRGRGPLKDEELGKSLIDRGCKLNDGFRCNDAIKTEADLAQARLTKDKEGCQNDDPNACGSMARRALETDPALALSLRIKACDLGNDHACHDASEQFVKGNGTPKNTSKALAFLEKTCARNTRNCHKLAASYVYDKIVAKDIDRAIELYQSACWADPTNGPTCVQAKLLQFKIL